MNILVYAYLNDNFGDDLFVKILVEKYPKHSFCIFNMGNGKTDFLRKKYNVTIKDVPVGVKVINLITRKIWNRNLAYEYISKSFDGFILIGGSMFIENLGWEKRCSQITSLVKSVTFKSIMGINFGPYRSRDFFLKHCELFKEFNDICFRDEKSYTLFEKLPNTRKGIDIAFALKPDCGLMNKGYTVISVCNFKTTLNTQDKKNYIRTIQALCKRLHNLQKKVILIGLCINEGDNLIINEIKSGLSYEIETKNYIGNLDEIIKIFAYADRIFATRFHSMIMGLLMQKVTIPLIYSEKMKNVLDDIKFKGLYYNVNDLENMDFDTCINTSYVCNISKYLEYKNIEFSYLDNLLIGDYE